jgi:hypothetical protein
LEEPIQIIWDFYVKIQKLNYQQYRGLLDCADVLAGHNTNHFQQVKGQGRLTIEGASIAGWLRLLVSSYWPLTTLGWNPNRDFGFFHARKLTS